ncbi:MAG: hypothetical protein KDA69_19830 [Planctomycetaceae bacterium]|nr:hypothetical protein [Planctomycetaceae bacterium]MCB9951976.1 hypothetical protein [Planctomycetaceae bacterium]
MLNAIELSALREDEVAELVNGIDSLDLDSYDYISVHAPSRLAKTTEDELARTLAPVFQRRWNVVIHPDVIKTPTVWRPYGELVCIENMDKRKPCGRTASELDVCFRDLPNASLCFDVAHARQIDPTMLEAKEILVRHGHRLRQVHLSSLASSSRHEPLGFGMKLAYDRISHLIDKSIPVILETPVDPAHIDEQLRWAKEIAG